MLIDSLIFGKHSEVKVSDTPGAYFTLRYSLHGNRGEV